MFAGPFVVRQQQFMGYIVAMQDCVGPGVMQNVLLIRVGPCCVPLCGFGALRVGQDRLCGSMGSIRSPDHWL